MGNILPLLLMAVRRVFRLAMTLARLTVMKRIVVVILCKIWLQLTEFQDFGSASSSRLILDKKPIEAKNRTLTAILNLR